MATLKSTRIVNVIAQNTGKDATRVVTGSFNATQARHVTVLEKFNRATESLQFAGRKNAQALRMLMRAKAGAGGAMDAKLIAQGKHLIKVQQASAAVPGLVSLSDAGLSTYGQFSIVVSCCNSQTKIR